MLHTLFYCTLKQFLYLHSNQAKYMLLSKYQFCRMSLNDLKCQWFCQCCQRCSWDFGPDSSFQDSTMQNGELPEQRTTTNGIIRTVWSSSCNHEKSDGVDPVCYFFCFVNYTPNVFILREQEVEKLNCIVKFWKRRRNFQRKGLGGWGRGWKIFSSEHKGCCWSDVSLAAVQLCCKMLLKCKTALYSCSKTRWPLGAGRGGKDSSKTLEPGLSWNPQEFPWIG